MFAKRFLQWIGLKEKLHTKQHRVPHVSEGEIWWASIGENVGSEINGKSDLFSRSIDYRRLSNKLGELDNADFTKVQNGFRNIYA